MNSKGKLNRAESQIQTVLGAFLKTRANPIDSESLSMHLDDDALAAFIEGNLSEREAVPVVAHLTDCGFCLHVSAELIKLDAVFSEDTPIAHEPPSDAKGIGKVLEGILSRIFGSDELAVFAHEEKQDEDEAQADQDSDTE